MLSERENNTNIHTNNTNIQVHYTWEDNKCICVSEYENNTKITDN